MNINDELIQKIIENKSIYVDFQPIFSFLPHNFWELILGSSPQETPFPLWIMRLYVWSFAVPCKSICNSIPSTAHKIKLNFHNTPLFIVFSIFRPDIFSVPSVLWYDSRVHAVRFLRRIISTRLIINDIKPSIFFLYWKITFCIGK